MANGSVPTSNFLSLAHRMQIDHIQKLRDTLQVQLRIHEPWTTGIVQLTEVETSLFFKCKDGSARNIDLRSITNDDIEALIAACDPAPFGRGTESVLDDTYRKALKLNDGAFSWRFNPDSGEFSSRLAAGFCPWQSDYFSNGIRAEPDKLNIYTKGGFFKAHQDTPRAENMFGSLVFVLPTHHQGGNLVLRHKARELNFDAPSIFSSSPSVSVPWVAFYSDIEHEVLEVTDGARITITFNLYFDHSRAPPIPLNEWINMPENSFTMALRDAFRDAGFICNPRYLGFGLEYKYTGQLPERLPSLSNILKGPDAFLYYVLEAAGLNPSLKCLYDYGSGTDYESDFWVMSSYLLQGRDERNEKGSLRSFGRDELEYIMEDDGSAKIVWRPGQSEETVEIPDDKYRWITSYFKKENIDEYRARTVKVDWVTPPTENLIGLTEHLEYGNEPAQEHFYYHACIVVDVSTAECPLPL